MRYVLLICISSVAWAETFHRGGVVIDVTTNEPIAGAVVTMGGKTTTSDAGGRFQIDGQIGAISASKPGYVFQSTARGDEWQDSTGDRYQPHMIVGMLALGTIKGQVVDAEGKPFAGPRIDVLLAARQINSGVADSDGNFELQVLPGSYRVCAIPQSLTHGQGTVLVAACYPSATDYYLAKDVTVVARASTQSLIIHLGEVPTYTIRGRITGVSAKNRKRGMIISVLSDDPDPYDIGPSERTYGCVKPDGSFTISDVPAGAYTLEATGGSNVDTTPCGAQPDSQVPGTMWDGERNLVLKSNVRGITVHVKPQKVVFDIQ
jgi:hypothetical protein